MHSSNNNSTPHKSFQAWSKKVYSDNVRLGKEMDKANTTTTPTLENNLHWQALATANDIITEMENGYAPTQRKIKPDIYKIIADIHYNRAVIFQNGWSYWEDYLSDATLKPEEVKQLTLLFLNHQAQYKALDDINIAISYYKKYSPAYYKSCEHTIRKDQKTMDKTWQTVGNLLKQQMFTANKTYLNSQLKKISDLITEHNTSVDMVQWLAGLLEIHYEACYTIQFFENNHHELPLSRSDYKLMGDLYLIAVIYMYCFLFQYTHQMRVENIVNWPSKDFSLLEKLFLTCAAGPNIEKMKEIYLQAGDPTAFNESVNIILEGITMLYTNMQRLCEEAQLITRDFLEVFKVQLHNLQQLSGQLTPPPPPPRLSLTLPKPKRRLHGKLFVSLPSLEETKIAIDEGKSPNFDTAMADYVPPRPTSSTLFASSPPLVITPPNIDFDPSHYLNLEVVSPTSKKS